MSTPPPPPPGDWQPPGGGWEPPSPAPPPPGQWGSSDPGWGAPSPQQPQWGGYATPPTNHDKATPALVLGIVGVACCPLVCSVLALVFGYRARREIDASQGRLGGRGHAVAGIVLGWVGIGLVVLTILFYALAFALGWDTFETYDDSSY